MGLICAVTFTDKGRLYYADPAGLTCTVGDHVLYPTTEGPEVAQVMWAPQWTSDDIVGLPTLVGMAADSDLAAVEAGKKTLRINAMGENLEKNPDFAKFMSSVKKK